MRKLSNMLTLRFTAVFCLIAVLCSSTFARGLHDPESRLNRRNDNINSSDLNIEHFPNGTNKEETTEELLEEYRKHANRSDTPEKFTDEPLSDVLDRKRRTIFGSDERLPCSVSSYPYCAVGILDSGCTAILVGPYHALTAAHCVYDISTNTWKDNLNLRRGRTCRTYGTTMYWTNAWILNGYALFHYDDYDFALIIYESFRPSPCYVGFGYRQPWTGVGFDIYGYPSDKSALLSPGCFYDSMYCTSCHYSLVSSSGLGVEYACDLFGISNTGAGLYAGQSDSTAGARSVYGVHTASGYPYNRGVLLDGFRFCKIIEWMEDSGYYPTCSNGPCCP